MCKCLLVCAGASIGDLCVPPTGLIPRFLTEGNMYLYFDASPFPLQGKINASSKGNRKNFCRLCRGGSTSSLPSTHHKLSSHALHYLPFDSHFLSPTSKTFLENHKKICLFIRPSSIRLFVCFLVARVLDCLLCHDDSREYQAV